MISSTILRHQSIRILLNHRYKHVNCLRSAPGILVFKARWLSGARQFHNSAPCLERRVNDRNEKKKVFSHLLARDVAPESDTYGTLGEEISGKKLLKDAMIAKLNEFYQLPAIRELAKTHYIDDKLFAEAFTSFRRYCYKSESLPPELHIKFCDIIDNHGHSSDLFPFFLTHARQAFPHLDCHEELRKISDLGQPHTWYPAARAKARKIIFHAGPTNSGKTFHALQRFMQSKSGVYCGPLKLLANEVFQKSNANNTPCDLVTGEERKLANQDGITKSEHVSCTVEMCTVDDPIEVAVIDEIQMIRDAQRGWAWTRALLGLPADEIHLCGEESALDLVQKMLLPTTDTLEVVRYKRLTPLHIEDKPLGSLENVRSGDCIVCFSKEQIYNVSMTLESLGHQVAVVYGTLPPITKLGQCDKFNRLEECTVMVATDAIGMGLNLSIGRIIFNTLVKTNVDAKGNRSQDYLSTSQCLQIAGRAGRYNTAHDTGYVTTLKGEDLRQLKEIMSRRVDPIDRAGLHPTADQMELFAYHLPHLGLAQLIDLFVDLCEFDSSAYFICDMGNFKLLAETIQHISLPLKSRYLFCCAPINTKFPYSVAMFTKFVRQYSVGEPVTASWMCRIIKWPPLAPKNLEDLTQLEMVYDVIECYLWLSFRFPEVFCEPTQVMNMQAQLEETIYQSLSNFVGLIKCKFKLERAKA